MENSVLLLHAAATWFMLGVIWFVQLGQYPLFANVGMNSFSAYYSRYTKAISLIVILPMFTELVTGAILLGLLAGSDRWNLCAIGFIFVLLIWGSTVFIQVPLHRTLEKSFSDKTQRLLVGSNWVRTFLWTARSFVVASLLYASM